MTSPSAGLTSEPDWTFPIGGAAPLKQLLQSSICLHDFPDEGLMLKCIKVCFYVVKIKGFYQYKESALDVFLFASVNFNKLSFLSPGSSPFFLSFAHAEKFVFKRYERKVQFLHDSSVMFRVVLLKLISQCSHPFL